MKTELAQGNSEPLYHQLKNVLLSKVRSGEWKLHSQIMSERELCDTYDVSRSTTRRAITDLVHEGWLYTVAGKGTYINDPPLQQALKSLTSFSEDLNARAIEVTSEVLNAERLEATADIADKLELKVYAPIIHLNRVRYAAGVPMAVQSAYLPEHLCPGLLRFDFSKASLYKVLRTQFDLILTQGHTSISAQLATKGQCTLLNLPDPSAVLTTFAVNHLQDGTPIEYCESVFHGKLYQLTSTEWRDRVMETALREEAIQSE